MLSTMIRPSASDTDDLRCVTQDEPFNRRFRDFYEVCTRHADTIINTRFCHDGCGGHPVCNACLKLAREKGWVA